MFCIKYKVRRNDTSVKTDLGSILPPSRVASATRFSAFRARTVPTVYRGNAFQGRIGQMSIWTVLFVILLIAWLGGFTVFHVAGGLIHLLLVFAVISLILHFVLGTRAA